jgi:hypothetical protein
MGSALAVRHRAVIELSGDASDRRIQQHCWLIRGRVWDELKQHGLLAPFCDAALLRWSSPIQLELDVQGDPRAIEDAIRRAVQDSPPVRALAVHVNTNERGAG